MDGLTKRIIILLCILTLCHIAIAAWKPSNTVVPNQPVIKQGVPMFQFWDMHKKKVPC